MASLDACLHAIDTLGQRLETVDPELRRRHAVDRSVACHISDLGVDVSGALKDGFLVGVSVRPDPKAQIKLRVSSDDLVAIVAGEMHAGHAWATGRLRITAPLRDMLRLRSFI